MDTITKVVEDLMQRVREVVKESDQRHEYDQRIIYDLKQSNASLANEVNRLNLRITNLGVLPSHPKLHTVRVSGLCFLVNEYERIVGFILDNDLGNQLTAYFEENK